MKKLSFDSTSTLKGIVFQFLVALDRCFEMQEGESVYIETFGDESLFILKRLVMFLCWVEIILHRLNQNVIRLI